MPFGLMWLQDAQGNPEKVDAIFSSTVSRFVGHYPHHKLLTHLGEAAKDWTAVDLFARHPGVKVRA